MTATQTPSTPPPANGSAKWTRIGAALGGGLLLAMQGVNISETTGQTHLIERLDVGLKQQSNLIQEVNHEGARIDKALINQQKMIESMDALLQNQNAALELLARQPKPNPTPQ